MRTRISELLSIKLPIIQAPMAGGPTTPKLVSAVSNAGGLGMIGAGYMTPEALDAAIKETRRKTDKPLGVNVFLHKNPESIEIPECIKERISDLYKSLGLDNPNFDISIVNNLPSQLDVLSENKVEIVTGTFGCFSTSDLKILKNYGAIVGATATCVSEAKIISDSGHSFVVLQGFEAGGHRGSFDDNMSRPLVGSMALIPQVSDSVGIPIVASGGISDGRGILAAEVLGASGFQMGTAFLTTIESGASESWKQAIICSKDTSTTLTKSFSGKLARGIDNSYIEHMLDLEDSIPEYPIMNTLTGPIRRNAKSNNNIDYMSLWSGQSASLAKIESVKDLFDRLEKEYNDAKNEIL